MSASQIIFKNRLLGPLKAIVKPDFTSKTVLVEDTWEYVKMWLRREGKSHALFYWEQAGQFHRAALQLPNTSAPLPAYYCFLNATKALLTVRGYKVNESHGVSGESTSKYARLSNEVVRFHGGGVLAGLCSYLGEKANGEEYSLSDILYNLVFIHRAYNLTFSSRPEIFFPLASPMFVRKKGSREGWFCAEIKDKRYANQFTIKKLDKAYERDMSPEFEGKKVMIRMKSRFDWKTGKSEQPKNIKRLTSYHKKVRRHLFYIQGPSRLWYIKRRNNLSGMIDRSSLTLTYSAMHRLSELARYDPMLLDQHLNSRHNWLLSEFIATARMQFIDEISSEITGQEFMIPGRRSAT